MGWRSGTGPTWARFVSASFSLLGGVPLSVSGRAMAAVLGREVVSVFQKGDGNSLMFPRDYALRGVALHRVVWGHLRNRTWRMGGINQWHFWEVSSLSGLRQRVLWCSELPLYTRQSNHVCSILSSGSCPLAGEGGEAVKWSLAVTLVVHHASANQRCRRRRGRALPNPASPAFPGWGMS